MKRHDPVHLGLVAILCLGLRLAAQTEASPTPCPQRFFTWTDLDAAGADHGSTETGNHARHPQW